MEESREADLRMMRDRFEDLVLRQETGRTRGSQDLAGGRTNSGGSLGDGPTTAGDGIPNVDPPVVVQAVDTRPTGLVVSVQQEWSKHHSGPFLVVRKRGELKGRLHHLRKVPWFCIRADVSATYQDQRHHHRTVSYRRKIHEGEIR